RWQTGNVLSPEDELDLLPDFLSEHTCRILLQSCGECFLAQLLIPAPNGFIRRITPPAPDSSNAKSRAQVAVVALRPLRPRSAGGLEGSKSPPLPVPLLHSEWRRGCPKGGRGGVRQFVAPLDAALLV